MKVYSCQCCNKPLENIGKDQYRCNNSSCCIRNSKITISEGLHDIHVIDEKTEGVRIENGWCTVINIKNKA
jgi:hypothetical protein